MKSIQQINALRTHLMKLHAHAYNDAYAGRMTCGPETCLCNHLGRHVHTDGPARKIDAKSLGR